MGDFGNLGFQIDINKRPLVRTHRNECKYTCFRSTLKGRLPFQVQLIHQVPGFRDLIAPIQHINGLVHRSSLGFTMKPFWVVQKESGNAEDSKKEEEK